MASNGLREFDSRTQRSHFTTTELGSFTGKKNKIGFNLDKFLNEVEHASNTLSQHKLDKIKKTINRAYLRRFKSHRREPKYGSVNKGFTELELQHFLRNAPNEKFRLLFKYQAYLGLRVGEVCKLHVSNIDFAKRELTIASEKSGTSDTLKIPFDLFKETYDFLTKNQEEVKAANGYVFFKAPSANKAYNGLQHLEVNYVRNMFRKMVKQSSLDSIYAYSDESYENHRYRRLYRLTTHSLRHYAITHFAKATNGNVVQACRFARHSKPETTMRYIDRDNEELFTNIDLVFSNLSKGIKA